MDVVVIFPFSVSLGCNGRGALFSVSVASGSLCSGEGSRWSRSSSSDVARTRWVGMMLVGVGVVAAGRLRTVFDKRPYLRWRTGWTSIRTRWALERSIEPIALRWGRYTA